MKNSKTKLYEKLPRGKAGDALPCGTVVTAFSGDSVHTLILCLNIPTQWDIGAGIAVLLLTEATWLGVMH
ncbi:hypothetical protein E2C01_005156 [Portunus trituberculatus]|uniref:Uncharacterized protein n=1 Tax=Portunus trituberculatus TaxID=210409 RepID=A0A5B7CTH8_PORTR|nr:hypothetical protein [Portunus trituberculatus]